MDLLFALEIDDGRFNSVPGGDVTLDTLTLDTVLRRTSLLDKIEEKRRQSPGRKIGGGTQLEVCKLNKNKGGYHETTLVSVFHCHSVSPSRLTSAFDSVRQGPVFIPRMAHADFRTLTGNSSSLPRSFGGNHFETLRKLCGI